jgi:DNA-binding MarR family transcriptional regulator
MDRFRGKKRQGKLPRYRPEVTRRSRPTASYLGALRFGRPWRLLDLSGELSVTARNVTGLVDALQRDGLVERLLHPNDRRVTWSGSPRQGTAWRALLAELPEAAQRHLVQALDTL